MLGDSARDLLRDNTHAVGFQKSEYPPLPPFFDPLKPTKAIPNGMFLFIGWLLTGSTFFDPFAISLGKFVGLKCDRRAIGFSQLDLTRH